MGNSEIIDIVVLSGGNSLERNVSLQSAQCIVDGYSRMGFKVANLDAKLFPSHNLASSVLEHFFLWTVFNVKP